MERRKVILHYHLFKNAGTSLDSSLKENFKGVEWATKEFPNNHKLNQSQLAEWIENSGETKCYSSHTAQFPPPKFDDIDVLPIVFVRNPLDRIASAYSFEKRQGGNSFGAVLARNTDFRGYIETRLALNKDRQCRNFHTYRLAMMIGEDQGKELERAVKAVDYLPYVGVVESYNQSLNLLEGWLQAEGFSDISIKAVEKNVSRNPKKSLSEKLDQMKDILGNECFDSLVLANNDDIKLYDYVVKRDSSTI